MKLGVIFILMSFAYLWTEFGSRGFSWVRQIGTTSLIVYWVHIELIYGRWFGSYKENLSVQETVAMAIVVTILMLGLSVVATRWRGWFGNSLSALWNQPPKKLPVSGD
jgi:fucose 4-O-acetylase-like acetyltransferase